MLYAIYVAELEEINFQECKIIQYANDVCIFSAMDSVEESLNRVESAADKISASLDNLNLTLSAEKTNYMYLTRIIKLLKLRLGGIM